MNNTTVHPNAAIAPNTRRNAFLAAVGVGLAGLGLAAGLAMRPSAPEAAPQMPVASVAPATQAVAPTPSPQAVPPVAQAEVPAVPPARYDAVRPAPHRVPAPRRGDDDRSVAVNDAGRPVPSVTPLPTRPVAVCTTCGVVEGVRTVQREGHGSGVGAVAGGVLGGVLGNRFGGGGGRTALTVLGAVGGGLAGNEAEKRTRTTTAYDVRVRMDDGTLRTFEQTTPISAGAHVIVDGDTLRLGSSSSSNGYGS